MVKALSWLVGLPFLAAAAVSGYAAPGACSGICTNAHDPSIVQNANGTYYRFSTGNKIAVHSAPDISGPWKYEGAALPDGSSIDLKGKDDLWVCFNASMLQSSLVSDHCRKFSPFVCVWMLVAGP